MISLQFIDSPYGRFTAKAVINNLCVILFI